MEYKKICFERIIDAANDLHQAICSYQNSGETDEYKCSKFVMMADDLREFLLYFRDEELGEEDES